MISNTNNRERNLHSAPEATERKKRTRVQDVANIRAKMEQGIHHDSVERARPTFADLFRHPRAIQRLGESDCNG
jgi:hypothetical protein